MTEREDTEKRVDDREEEEKRKRCKKEETAIETGLRGEKKEREDKDNISKAATYLFRLVQGCTSSYKQNNPESDKLNQLGLFSSQVE